MYTFCDWITVRIPLRHSNGMFGDSILRLSPDGQQVWEKRLWQSIVSEGSFSSAVSIRSLNHFDIMEPYFKGKSEDAELKARLKYGADLLIDKDYCFVEISGNPTKFFQGHNVWGSDDYKGIVEDFIIHVLCKAGFEVSSDLEARIKCGDFYISRFDLTGNIDLGNTSEKSIFLMAMQQQAESKRGKKHSENMTSAFGARGRLQVKFYDKLSEVIAHWPQLPKADLGQMTNEHFKREFDRQCAEYQKLVGFLGNVVHELTGYVRLETTIGSKFLSEKNVSKFSKFLELVADEPLFVRDRLKNLKLGAMAMNDKSIEGMTKKLEELIKDKVIHSACLGAFRLWVKGENVAHMYPTNTFYRHRRAILKHLPEVDISLPLPADKEAVSEPLSNVIHRSFAKPSKKYYNGIYEPFSKVVQMNNVEHLEAHKK